MKKVLCFLLALCCFAGILGCDSEDTTAENVVKVYYQREKPIFGTADGVIADIAMDATGHENEHTYLLNQYLKSVPAEGFVSPYPTGVFLVGFKVEGLTAKVVLSDRIADLTGMDLTIALICMAQTVMSMTGSHEVIISATTKQLDGQNFVTLNRDSYLLLDNSGAVPNE
jgi:hypothetical protein